MKQRLIVFEIGCAEQEPPLTARSVLGMAGSLPLLSLNHISRVVKDVQASIDFFVRVLGFIEIKRPSSFHFEGAWCALAAAGHCWRPVIPRVNYIGRPIRCVLHPDACQLTT